MARLFSSKQSKAQLRKAIAISAGLLTLRIATDSYGVLLSAIIAAFVYVGTSQILGRFFGLRFVKTPEEEKRHKSFQLTKTSTETDERFYVEEQYAKVSFRRFLPFIIPVSIFFQKNWYRIFLVLSIGFGLYWWGVRPSQIRAECAWVINHYDEKPAVPASPNWPQCEEEISKIKSAMPPCSDPENLLKCFEERKKYESIEFKALVRSCKQPEDAIPARTERKEATKDEYSSCLRKHGL